MASPFEHAWLLLKQGVSPIGPDSPMHGYDERRAEERAMMPVMPDITTPFVEDHYRDRFRELRGEAPPESHNDKIKRLLADEEARSTYDPMSPPADAPVQTPIDAAFDGLSKPEPVTSGPNRFTMTDGAAPPRPPKEPHFTEGIAQYMKENPDNPGQVPLGATSEITPSPMPPNARFSDYTPSQ